MSAEYDFPTVRHGSYVLLAFTGVLMIRILWKGATSDDVKALEALLTAVAATHGILVLGGSFMASKLAAPHSNTGKVVEKTTEKIVTTTPAKVENATIEAENVNIN